MTGKQKSESKDAQAPGAVKAGDKVVLEYEGKLDDGQVFDTTNGRQPLEYVAGEGQLLPAFEQHIMGMAKDEEKAFTLKPAEGYGVRDESLTRDIPRTQFPQNLDLKEGAMLVIRTPDGKPMLARIAKLGKDTATLDFNHPLAGKTLHFKVKVVGIGKAG
jgi:peptidylprolyl isomerase